MGFIINLEAIDGAGKDTQLKLLFNSLKKSGLRVRKFSFPVYSSNISGSLIRRFLDNKLDLSPEAAQVLFSINRRESINHILRMKQDNDLLILSRYNLSGRVYAEATGVAREVLNEFEQGLPAADLIILLDASPSQLADRRSTKDRYESSDDLQNRSRALFLQYAADNDNIKLINANAPIERVQADIQLAICRNWTQLGYFDRQLHRGHICALGGNR